MIKVNALEIGRIPWMSWWGHFTTRLLSGGETFSAAVRGRCD
jgi:hypothetical protein